MSRSERSVDNSETIDDNLDLKNRNSVNEMNNMKDVLVTPVDGTILYAIETQNKNTDDHRIDRDTQSQNVTPNTDTSIATTATKKEVFLKLFRFLPSEIMKKKICYFPCITHLIGCCSHF